MPVDEMDEVLEARRGAWVYDVQAATFNEERRRASLPPSWSIQAGLVIGNDVCSPSHRQTVADEGARAASLSHARNVRPWSPLHGPGFCDPYVEDCVAHFRQLEASRSHARVRTVRPFLPGRIAISDVEFINGEVLDDVGSFDDVRLSRLHGRSASEDQPGTSLLKRVRTDDARRASWHGWTALEDALGTSSLNCGCMDHARPSLSLHGRTAIGDSLGTSSLNRGRMDDSVAEFYDARSSSSPHSRTARDYGPGTSSPSRRGTVTSEAGSAHRTPPDRYPWSICIARPGRLWTAADDELGTSSPSRRRTATSGAGSAHRTPPDPSFSYDDIARPGHPYTPADDGPGTSSPSRRRTVTSEAGSVNITESGGNFELDVLRRPGTLSPPLHTLDDMNNMHMSRSWHAPPDEGAAPSQIRFPTLVDMSALLPSRVYQDRGDPDSPRRRRSALVDLEAQITPPSAYLPESVVTGEQNSATKWRARYWAGFFTVSFSIFASLALDPHFPGSTRAAFAVVATSSWAGLTTVLDRAFPVFKNTDMIGFWFVLGALLASLMAWQSFKENNVHAAT